MTQTDQAPFRPQDAKRGGREDSFKKAQFKAQKLQMKLKTLETIRDVRDQVSGVLVEQDGRTRDDQHGDGFGSDVASRADSTNAGDQDGGAGSTMTKPAVSTPRKVPRPGVGRGKNNEGSI